MRLLYPKITGTVCANSHPGSYTGQDAYNDMFLVLTSHVKPSGTTYGGGYLAH